MSRAPWEKKGVGLEKPRQERMEDIILQLRIEELIHTDHPILLPHLPA